MLTARIRLNSQCWQQGLAVAVGETGSRVGSSIARRYTRRKQTAPSTRRPRKVQRLKLEKPQRHSPAAGTHCGSYDRPPAQLKRTFELHHSVRLHIDTRFSPSIHRRSGDHVLSRPVQSSLTLYLAIRVWTACQRVLEMGQSAKFLCCWVNYSCVSIQHSGDAN